MKYEKLNSFKEKKVLVTGNTGFKGSWITMILLELGAEVVGYSLDPPTTPSIYEQLNLEKRIYQYKKDVRSLSDLINCLKAEQPDIIFHLAAQPLVRESYQIPMETMDINIFGTLNLLEAVRQLNLKTNVVFVSTDKCYENREWVFGYRERDHLGGHDPYSASKGAAEIVLSSYKRSFFSQDEYRNHKVKIASARAGNVIGGGDWSNDRIIPDIIRALIAGEKVFVRNPKATRPWQHVLEPLSGYLLLGSYLLEDRYQNEYCDAFNFGPLINSNKDVRTLTDQVIEKWGSGEWYTKEVKSFHEANLLNLTIDKAYHLLKWSPSWTFEKTIEATVEWYQCFSKNPEKLEDLTIKQIGHYLS